MSRAEMTRVRPDERPPYFTGSTPLNGSRPLRCPEEQYRALDDMLGKWMSSGESGTRVSLRILPILGGCALMAFAESDQWSEFQVRAIDPGTSTWVEYRVENIDEELVRAEGGLDGDTLRLESSDSIDE